ncbi:MAG: hypothetical protein HN521_15660, partial [Candidatus Latescibacteria bacterium]|nr:hypothetical protein [Candidatus Latescibacterota bacterium]
APSVDALYDLVNDPLEMNNVIDQHNDMAQELKDRLVSWLGKVDSPHLDGVMARMINQ